MDRCPTCQARLRESPVCGRCETDLRLPLAAEAEAARQLRRGLQAWLAGDRPAAHGAVEKSLSLKRVALAGVLLRFMADSRRPDPLAANEAAEVEPRPHLRG